MKIFLRFFVLGLLNIFFFHAHSQTKLFCGDGNTFNYRNSSTSSSTSVCDTPFLYSYYPYDSTDLKNYYLYFIIKTDSAGNPIGGITKEDIDFLMLNTNAILNPHKFNYCYNFSYTSVPLQEDSLPFQEMIQYVYINNFSTLGLSGNPIHLDYIVVQDSSSEGGRVLGHEIGHNQGLVHVDTDPANLMHPSSPSGTLLTDTQIAIMHCTPQNSYIYARDHPYFIGDLDFGNEVCNNFGKPYALFYTNNYGGCVPLQVPFYDSTFLEPTKWLWDFGDGSFDTSANPVHTYTKAEKYNVTLVVSNNYGSDTLTKNNYIVVTDSVYSLPIYEDFEDTSDSWFTPSKDWYVANPDYFNMYFEKYSKGVPAQTGSTCIRIMEPSYSSDGTPPTIGQVNSLVTPPMDLRYVKNPYITFNYAYPLIQDYINEDTLYIYASTDCSNSFKEVYKKFEDLLAIGFKNDSTNILGTIFIPYDSVQYRYNNFYPYVSEAWKKDSINLSSLEGEDSVVFKFTFYSTSYRYLYLDDILISADKISGLPVADFIADTTTIYKNDTIHFTNLSNKYSDTLQWFFTGATITTSNDTNPSIVYDSVGTFPVTLVVWNMFGKDTLTKLAYINVLQKIDTIPCDSLKITTSVTNATCYGKNDGTATVSAYEGNIPYTYSWSNGDTARVVNNLFAGIYSITVTDSINCFATDTVNISEPDSFSIIIISDSATFNQSTGYIDLTITGGTTPYQYLWSNNATSQDVDSLPAGNYSVYITDVNSCKDSLSVTIYETTSIQSIQFNIQNFNLYPNPNTGTFTINLELLALQNIQITMANLNGQIIYTENIEKTMHYKKDMNLLSQSKGIYTLTLKTPQTTITRQVVYE